jgi:hypothetical protein
MSNLSIARLLKLLELRKRMLNELELLTEVDRVGQPALILYPIESRTVEIELGHRWAPRCRALVLVLALQESFNMKAQCYTAQDTP